MSLRIVLLTRSGRPSGAQMAWRLFESGMPPAAVIVEKRGRIVKSKKSGSISRILGLGFGFLWKKILEMLRIRAHYYLRRLLRTRFKDPAYLSIEELALDYPVRIYEVDDHNSSEVQELLWRIQPDIGVLTNTRKITKEILSLPRCGFFNMHLSALPQYAGLDSIFWALYHGEKEIGVTVHFAAEEIDRGEIVCQEKIRVSEFDNEDTLYTKALWLGTYLMAKALKQLENGTLKSLPQKTEQASYFSWPTPKDRAVLRNRKPPHLYPCLSGRQALPLKGERNGEGVKVLHVITRMIRGGAQENTLASVRGLLEKGYEVTLLTGPTWGNEGEIISEALLDRIEVMIIPELIRELHPVKDFIVFLKLYFLLVKHRYTIIHTHTSKAGFLGRMAARFARVSIIIHTPHGHVFHSYFSRWKERFFLEIERWTAKWSDRLIALTEVEKREHLDLEVGVPQQWVTIPSGINEKRFEPVSSSRRLEILSLLKIPIESKVVGFIGRLTSIKGPRYFLEAIPKIRQEFSSAHFLFVGDGNERRLLEERMNELNLDRWVSFVGHQTRVSEFLSLFDILVVPSLNEGMGRVIVEAGFLGKPVIGARIGGIPDLIKDGETGVLVQPRNFDEIARATVCLLKEPLLGHRLGKNLQKKVLSGFTEKYMTESMHDLYQVILSQKKIIFSSPGNEDLGSGMRRDDQLIKAPF